MHSEVKALVQEFKPGYRLGKYRGSQKREVLGPDGEIVRLGNGQPVVVPETPRVDGHFLKQMRGNFIRAGIIERGGKGGGTGGGGGRRSGAGIQRYGVRRLPPKPGPEEDGDPGKAERILKQQLRSTAIDLLRAGHRPKELVELLAQACREVDREGKDKDAQTRRSA